jgi:hypothetical protein
LHWKLTLVKILCHREFIHSPGRCAPVTDERRSAKVDTHDISRNELKELIREAIISTLTERRDLLEDAFAEAILDMKLGLAIEEGDTGEYSEEENIISKLAD